MSSELSARIGAGLMAVVAMMMLAGPAVGQTTEYPRYGTTHDDPRRGEVVAVKYPGNLYGIQASGWTETADRQSRLELSRKVMRRAAQLALENDRPVFSAFAPSTTTLGGETRHVPAGASTSQWHGRMTSSGQVVALQEVVSPGAPSYSYQLPSYEGSATMVKLWAQDEATLRGAKPADGMTDYQAEQVYLDLASTTGERWPDLAEIYEGVAARALQAGGNPPSTPARVVAIRNYLKAAAAHAIAGRQAQSLRAVEQARALVEES